MKRKIYQSIKFKLVLLTVAICAVLALSINFYTIRSSKGNYEEMTRNYLYDLAVTCGNSVDTLIMEEGTENALHGENLAATLKGVGIKGIESSYAYIVDREGTMLYHPTADKIGKKVENAVVTQLVEDLGKGKTHDPDIVEYEFKGAIKYASYSMNKTGDYILVISADKDEVMGSFSKITISSSVIAVVEAILAIVLMYFFITLLLKPLHYAMKSVDNLAALDFRVMDAALEDKYLKSNDEVANILYAIRDLRGKLAEVVNEIRGQSNQLFEASTRLNASAEETSNTIDSIEKAVIDIAEGATSQAVDTQKATEDVIEIGMMVEQTDGSVSTLKSNADDIEKMGQSASETLISLESVNDKAKEYIDAIYEQTNMTNESVQKIGNAVQLITSIAEETNLLSLNASIEAARAGEQGKGFAVVAAQIQKLAEQSNNSAQEIEEIIHNLMTESEKAVATMDDVKKIMAQQSEKMEMTDRIFKDVLNGIIHSREGIESIASNTRALDGSRKGIVDIVQNLSAVAEENAASTEQTSAAVTEMGASVQEMSSNADQLNKIAENLDNSVKKFQM